MTRSVLLGESLCFSWPASFGRWRTNGAPWLACGPDFVVALAIMAPTQLVCVSHSDVAQAWHR